MKLFSRSISILSLLLSAAVLSAQTDTRYDTGMNLPFNEKAGDVNPQTGTVTLGATDVQLPGRSGLDFRFGRVWSTSQSNVYTMYRDQTTGENRLGGATVEARTRLGVGWSSSLPVIYDDLSSGELVQYLFEGGSVFELDQGGLDIKNPARSNLLWYDLLDKRIYHDESIAYADHSDLVAGTLAAEGVADSISERSRYVLIYADNAKTWFRADGQILMQQDRTSMNRIWYFYNAADKLTLVIDSVGRHIRFAYDNVGNLASVSWTVSVWTKQGESRVQQTQTRSVTYGYQSLGAGGAYPRAAWLAGEVVDYRTPYALTSVTDPMGHQTQYGYTEAASAFTYDDTRSHSQNVSLLLTRLTSVAGTDGSYLNQRIFTYNNPDSQAADFKTYKKYFYAGYMESFKLHRQYWQDRRGRIMNDTRYSYYENGQNGNYQSYSTVIEVGNTKSTYRYSLSGTKSQDNVLDTLTLTTADGFTQLTDFTYTSERTRSLEEVFRQGSFAYRQKEQYDSKGRPTRIEDRRGLVTVVEYDPTYGLPLKEYRTLTVAGSAQTYQREWTLTSLGQVATETVFLKGTSGTRSVRTALNAYDGWGNLVSVTNALGRTIHTEYDSATHSLPTKIWQQVNVASWANGQDVHANWLTEPTSLTPQTIRSWKEYNSDGSVWLEVDNDGWAVESFYDALGTKIETTNPNEDDVRTFATESNDPSRVAESPSFTAFLASRIGNPGARIAVDYAREFVRTTADLNRSLGQTKVTSVQKDGLGHVETETEEDGAGNPYSEKTNTYDTLGRMVATTDPDAASAWTSISVNGTSVQRHDKTWLVKYDDLGRKILVVYPEVVAGRSDRKTISYNDLENSVTTTDPDGRVVYQRLDWSDQIIEVVEKGYGSGTTQKHQFVYDELGRKVRFIDPKGITTSYRWDERDLMVEQTYGESGGSDLMSYDDVGQLVRKSDRLGQILIMTYDELGRNTAVLHYESAAKLAAQTPVRQVTTVYDHRGNPVRIASESLVEHYLYDGANRVTTLERRLTSSSVRGQVALVWGGDAASQTFAFTYQYNDAGMVTQMIYPDGSVHRFDYDPALGRLTGIAEGAATVTPTSFIPSLTYNKSGQVTQMTYGNATSQAWTFDQRKRISRIQITGPAGVLEDNRYTLSPSGNVLTINDHEYGYDGFNRIASAKTKLPENVDKLKLIEASFGTVQGADPIGSAVYNPLADLNTDGRINGVDHTLSTFTVATDQYDIEAFAYDANGNRTILTQNGDEYSYEYGPRNQLAKIWLKKKGATTKTVFGEYTYDANGNTTSRKLYTATGTKTMSFVYDTLNRLIRTTEVESGKQTLYTYDNAGNRLLKSDANGLTLYLRHGQIAVAMDIEVYAPTSPEGATKQGTVNRYVLSGDLLAGRIQTVTAKNGTKTTTKSYYHLDHLNSTKAVTKADGTFEVQYVYRAFGEQLRKLGTGDATYTYGGKELDDATNLYYFNARYYDATTGRFINVDPIQDGTNWYVYCSNNPLGMVDPTGLRTGDKAGDVTVTPAGVVELKGPASKQVVSTVNNLALTFDRSESSMTSKSTTTTTLADGTTSETSQVESFFASNNVKTPAERNNIPVSFHGYRYFPSTFPNGNWTLGTSGTSQDPIIGPYIRTDATRTVQTYTKAQNGTWSATGQTVDGGFLIHGGTPGENGPTWGCIKMSDQNVGVLAQKLAFARSTGGTGSLLVQD